MKYARDFGFGEQKGIDLPGEESGILFNPEDMRDSDMATSAIGQSIAVTPLQLVTAVSAIANDGVLLKPHIVKSIRNADGSVYEERGKTEVRRVIDSATDKTLMGLLEQVVSSGGGAKAQVKGYRIAGKTGTAQKIREDGSGYMDGRYIASFCGFAPVEDPQLTVLVMIDDPSAGNFYGGQIAAPVAGRIFAQLFRYLHIEPSSDPFAGMEPAEEKKPRHRPAKPFTGVVPDGKVVVPDFTGKSLREAAGLAADKGLSFQSEGSGYAVGQSIELNTLVDKGTTITVYFEPG
jgi:stage V sporulation protein D (sporulation-specific penicillin-binding protein)